MEDALQAIAVGVVEDVLIELHGLLFVAAKEVYLDALHANLLQPSHLTVATDGRAHAVLRRLRGVVLKSVRVVPEHQRDALRLGILRQLLNAVAAYLLVPPVVHQAVLIAHGRRQVDEPHLVVVVDGVVLPDEPRPCIAPWGRFPRWRIDGLHHIVGHGSLDDGLQCQANRDGAPRRAARQCHTHVLGAVAIVLSLLRESDSVALACLVVTQVRPTVASRHTSLGNQHPSLVISHFLILSISQFQMEQAWECIALPKLRLHAHGLVGQVVLFIAGLRALPTRHRTNLRTEEGRGLLREIKRRHLTVDDHRLRVATLGYRQLILIGHVVVRHLEVHLHDLLLRCLEGDAQRVGHVVDMAALGLPHIIIARNLPLFGLGQRQPFAEISVVGHQAQPRAVEHRFVVIADRVVGPAVLIAYSHHESSVRRAHRLCLSCHRADGSQQHRCHNHQFLHI